MFYLPKSLFLICVERKKTNISKNIFTLSQYFIVQFDDFIALKKKRLISKQQSKKEALILLSTSFAFIIPMSRT
jgi:hypothetical protein